MTNDEIGDRLAIRELVENWALFRDARRWDRFRELWHAEGRMITTWVRAPSRNLSRPAKQDTRKAFASCTFWRHNDRSQRGPSDRSNQDDHIATGRY